MTSPWISQTCPAGYSWNSVCFGSGLFVAVSSTQTNRVMTSPDGIIWTSRITPTNNWTSICYGNNQFVAVANSTTTDSVMTSPNGINWTIRSAVAGNWNSVCYGNNRFVAVANSTTTDSVMTSPDGIIWTSRIAVAGNWTSICYGNGLFVAVATTTNNVNSVMTSTDGMSWTIRSAVASNWRSVCFINSIFVAVSTTGSTSRVMTSGTYISCYLIGTNILCLNAQDEEVYIPIENIKTGQLVKTYKQGYRAVELIGKNTIFNNPSEPYMCLYKMKDAALTVSGLHFLLVDKLPDNLTTTFYKCNYTIEDKQALLAADSDLFEQITDTSVYTLFHLVLEGDIQYGIYADGVLTESTTRKNFIKQQFENTGY